MSSFKRRIAVISAPIAAAATIFAGAGPAAAHDSFSTVWIGGGTVWVAIGHGGVKSSHTRAYACDTLADNRGVRTWYWTAAGGLYAVGDANGSKSGCGEESSRDGSTITAYQVCAGVNGADTYCTAKFSA